jgi:hypothetical protein
MARRKTAIALSTAKMIAFLKFDQQDNGDRTISLPTDAP